MAIKWLYNFHTGKLDQTSVEDAWLLNGNTLGAKKTIGSIDNQDFGIITNGLDRVTVLGSNGYVGIGTTNPLHRLDVVGNININTNGTAMLMSSYQGADSVGYNSFIGGGGQSSIGEVGATYKGSYNSAQGVNALFSNTTGFNNSAQGLSALRFNTTGNSNSAQGVNALYFNTTGNSNSAQGMNALFSNTTGNYNSAQGLSALRFNTTGNSNSAQGVSALYSNTTGYYNSAQGYAALFSNTTGYYNSAQGASAGRSITTGSSNTFVGYYAGYHASQLTSAVNSMALGNGTYTTANNQVVLGNDSIVETLLKGKVTLNNIQVFSQYTTATEPAYVKGAQFFNTTLNKMRIGGATVWETVQST